MEKFKNRKIKISEVQNFKKNKNFVIKIGCTSRASRQNYKAFKAYKALRAFRAVLCKQSASRLKATGADVARHVPTVGVNHGQTARVKGRGLMGRKPLCKCYNTSSGMNPDSNGCGGHTPRVSLAMLGRARVNYTSSAVPTPKHKQQICGCTSRASLQQAENKAFADVARHVPTVGVNHGQTAGMARQGQTAVFVEPGQIRQLRHIGHIGQL